MTKRSSSNVPVRTQSPEADKSTLLPLAYDNILVQLEMADGDITWWRVLVEDIN